MNYFWVLMLFFVTNCLLALLVRFCGPMVASIVVGIVVFNIMVWWLAICLVERLI